MSGCGRGNFGGVGGILAVYASARHAGELHSGIRVHNAIHIVYLAGTGAGRASRVG